MDEIILNCIMKLLIFSLTFSIILYYSENTKSQTLPSLPNTDSVITCFPDTSGYTKITVGPVGRDYSDLQIAIDVANPGSVIVIDAGETFYGGFTLPDKSGAGWILIMSSRMDLLPAEETRIDPFASTGDFSFPTQSDAMPKIITNNTSGIPCIITNANAHHYRLVGLEITAATTVINSYGLINFGDGSTAQNSLSLVPHHLNIDRCYIHGHSNAQIMKFGVRLDCENAAIIDSYISEFHSIGFDAQAICGINGPGKFKIINNYLEASGENIMFGGAAPAISGLVPSDIEIRQNYFYKPFFWRVGDPTYAGNHWTVKNLFELKTGIRVLLDGNIMENSWADLPIGQSGYAILLTIRTESGAAPQADVSDVTISNNIIRHCGAGITLSGSDGGAGIRSKRIHIYNNLFDDINGPVYGDLNIAGPNDGTFLKIGEPRDVIINHNTIFQSGPVTWAYDTTSGFVFTNNMINSFTSAGGYQGVYGPGNIQGNNLIAHYFPDVSDSNMHFTKNVMIGGDSSKYSNYTTFSSNYFPSTPTNIGFVNFPNGQINYHGYELSNSSIYLNAGTDIENIGVNFSRLDSALNVTRDCPLQTTILETDNKNVFSIFPNPINDFIVLDKIYSHSLLSITDLSGKIIFTSVIESGESQVIKLPGLNRGLYAVRIANEQFSYVTKIVVAN